MIKITTEDGRTRKAASLDMGSLPALPSTLNSTQQRSRVSGLLPNTRACVRRWVAPGAWANKRNLHFLCCDGVQGPAIPPG